MKRRKTLRQGFTLVELLVVITIITILAALITVAAWRALVVATEVQIGAEIATLSQAMEQYRGDHIGYPPCDTRGGIAGLSRHLRSSYRNTQDDGSQGRRFDNGNTAALNQLDPTETLVFYLGGGIKESATRPLTGTQDKIYFEFDQTRLKDPDGDGFPSYQQKAGAETLLCYFDHANYDTIEFVATDQLFSADAGVCRAYRSDTNEKGSTTVFQFHAPNKFQIISAGADGRFGGYPNAAYTKRFPSGTGYQEEDRDNISTFSDSKKFEDHLP